jgi:hypothetical protein
MSFRPEPAFQHGQAAKTAVLKRRKRPRPPRCAPIWPNF